MAGSTGSALRRKRAPADQDGAAREAIFEFERMLMDADRSMMQTLQASLSLIGFGITMNTFFNNVAQRGQFAEGERMARGVGLALLAVGLFLLAGGVWSQARYRQDLLRRYQAVVTRTTRGARLGGRLTPSFVTAAMLLVIGIGALVSIIIRRSY
jgi:uncharacterized membrane protein YidH (DUF202 family)